MGPQRKNAAGDLAWLVKTIHAEICVPLVLRSDDPQALEAGLKAAKDQVLIDATLPGCPISIPSSTWPGATALPWPSRPAPRACRRPPRSGSTLVSETLLPKALDAGLALDDVYVDPLTTALTCDQPMVPVAVETLRLLKIAAEPAPNTLVHLADVTDGVADAAKPYISQAYLTMLLAAGLDALVANALDPDLMEAIRVVTRARRHDCLRPAADPPL